MKFLVVVAALVASAAANPGFAYSTGLGYSALGLGHVGLGYAAAPALAHVAPAAYVAPAYHKTQYHAQDALGQSSHGYAYPGQAAAETRDAAGNVRGSYAYVNPEGQEIRVNYVADSLGFRADSNALPVAPAATIVGPAPVLDTPEVAHAKAAHFAAHAEALARHGRKKRGLGYAVAAPLATSYAYSTSTVHAAAPALTYAAAPALTYAAAPAVAYAAPAVTYAAAVRPGILTTVHNNPGHAVSYRVY